MSVTPPAIQIPIIWGGISDTTKGAKKITAALRAAVMRGLTRAIRDTITYAEQIVTESIEREPPYPLSYESEAMLDSYITELRKELRNIKRQSHNLTPVITIQQKWPASYTKYVNEMVGVRWSKAGAESHFIEKLSGFLCRVAFEHVLAEIKRSEILTLEASKYMGT